MASTPRVLARLLSKVKVILDILDYFIKLIDFIWDYTFEPHGYMKTMLYDNFTKVKPASSGHTRIATNGLRTTSTRLSRFCLVLRFFFLRYFTYLSQQSTTLALIKDSCCWRRRTWTPAGCSSPC